MMQLVLDYNELYRWVLVDTNWNLGVQSNVTELWVYDDTCEYKAVLHFSYELLPVQLLSLVDSDTKQYHSILYK